MYVGVEGTTAGSQLRLPPKSSQAQALLLNWNWRKAGVLFCMYGSEPAPEIGSI
jgi:hypothetical protein